MKILDCISLEHLNLELGEFCYKKMVVLESRIGYLSKGYEDNPIVCALCNKVTYRIL